MPLDAVVQHHARNGPLSINHFGQLPAVTVSFNLSLAISLGQAAAAGGRRHAEMRMPPTITANFQGTVKEFQSRSRT